MKQRAEHTDDQIAAMRRIVASHTAKKRWAKIPKKQREAQLAPMRKARKAIDQQRAATRRAEYKRLKAAGLDDAEIAERMGFTEEGLRHWRWRTKIK